MSHVFVYDTNKTPLDPIHPAKARLMLKEGKAAVYRRFPFTLILKTPAPEAIQVSVSPLRLKIAPGSKTTGVAVVNDATGEVLFAAELTHKKAIKDRLETRRAIRRSRRQRKTRYRQPRFSNRRRKEGWFPPSLESRMQSTMTWVYRLMHLCPIHAISLCHLKFDPAAMKMEYEQGSIEGYEVREYLLDKWQRRCAYCGKENIPLTIDHILPTSRGGKGNTSNLCLACEPCNTAKGNKTIEEYLAKKPELRKKILAQAKAPLKDAGQLNSTRWALFSRLNALAVDLECGTGARTKMNRTIRGLEKTHWLNAACVGQSTPENLKVKGVVPLLITAMGHGTRQMCQTDKYGFPKQHRQRKKHYFGFQTGDMIRAIIPRGKFEGVHIGRVTMRASGNFKIKIAIGDISCSYKYCKTIHKNDGYQYGFGKRTIVPTKI